MRVQLQLVSCVLLLVGCASDLRHDQLTNIPLAQKPSIPRTEAECLAARQYWTEQGLPGGSKSCAVRTNDARKICTAQNQCEGECLVADALPIGAKAIGSCSEWVANFGCHKFIEGDRVREICSD